MPTTCHGHRRRARASHRSVPSGLHQQHPSGNATTDSSAQSVGGRHSQFRVAGATPRLLLPTHRAGLWHFHRASKCSRPAGTDQTRTPNAASMPTLVKTISVSSFWRGGNAVDVTPRKHLLHGHPMGRAAPTHTAVPPSRRQRLSCDPASDVLGSPHGDPRGQLQRLREGPRLDASPQGGLRERHEYEHLWLSQEAGVRKYRGRT